MAAVAQADTLIVGGQDFPKMTGPTVCERDLDRGDAALQWLGETIRSLCKRGDANSLLAAYLLSAPTFASSAQVDDRLLHRAYGLAKSDAKLLWLLVARSECASMIPAGCKAATKAVQAADALTQADAGNAMAWFALAYAKDLALADPREVDAILDRAAGAPRVHDYSFDLTKLVAQATADTGARSPASTSLQEIRWERVTSVSLLSWPLLRWATETCQIMSYEGDPERTKSCKAAQMQFKHGDSRLTRSGDPAELDSSMQYVGGHPDTRQAMLDAIGSASSEREWYGKWRAAKP